MTDAFGQRPNEEVEKERKQISALIVVESLQREANYDADVYCKVL